MTNVDKARYRASIALKLAAWRAARVAAAIRAQHEKMGTKN